MSKTVRYTTTALSEDDNARARVFSVNLFLREQDNAGNDLAGEDRWFVAMRVMLEGDDGTAQPKKVIRQLNKIPDGILSNAEKRGLVRVVKKLDEAARKVLTPSD